METHRSLSSSIRMAIAAVMTLTGCAAAPREEALAELEAPAAQVFGNFGPHTAALNSYLSDQGEVLHGLQVSTEDGWLREASVYDRGELIRHFAFHRSGAVFLESQKDAAGDGFMHVWNDEAEVLFTGQVRAGKRWNGSFLVLERLPRTYGETQVMLHEYREGELVRRAPFPFERAGVEPPDDAVDPKNWPWKPLEWPDPPYVVAPETPAIRS
jgi:hypothetical protein